MKTLAAMAALACSLTSCAEIHSIPRCVPVIVDGYTRECVPRARLPEIFKAMEGSQ